MYDRQINKSAVSIDTGMRDMPPDSVTIEQQIAVLHSMSLENMVALDKLCSDYLGSPPITANAEKTRPSPVGLVHQLREALIDINNMQSQIRILIDTISREVR